MQPRIITVGLTYAALPADRTRWLRRPFHWNVVAFADVPEQAGTITAHRRRHVSARVAVPGLLRSGHGDHLGFFLTPQIALEQVARAYADRAATAGPTVARLEPPPQEREPCAIHPDGHLYGCPVTAWQPPRGRTGS